MTRSRSVPLDWRGLRSDLNPHLGGVGGVVHVEAGSDAPTQMFADVLRDIWLPASPPEWVILRVDPADETLHYPMDVVREIASLIGYILPCDSAVPPINIAPDARSDRDLLVADIQIEVHADRWSQVDRVTVEALCRELDRFLEDRRLAMIFTDTHQIETKDRRRLAQTLWRDRLEDLLDRGLLLITIHDATMLRGEDACGFPPTATTTVALPPYFPASQDRKQAIEDLAQHAIGQGWHPDRDQAAIYAEGLVNSSATMGDLQARIATYAASRAVS